MQGNTHIVGGITASLAFAQFSNDNPLVLVGAGVIGALLPDICHRGSKIGRTFPIIAKLVNTVFGHRSFTHSLLFLLLVMLVLHTLIPYRAISIGVIVGMASHIVLDMCTKKGVKLFFPASVSIRFPLTTKTGSKVEGIVLMLLSMLSIYLSYELIARFIYSI
ncbi:metal-dependent hydrolase [Lysinibacillus irui]|uniref:Metal-dependent hydrolase n=1 Tax=Lysinibacillus irui TaxID=2998077 RepID=A0ABU5NN28_9BACI|nr:metal-dependent hydrolase [Lysinibacillus irui]MEA0552321.1 metal-dependent hydrolase [Lysinibacillus irui]MEA0977453.1 metal-dependent hydrolase [Lysinibacillus irui]MEA1043607.1 metal-dependent hydrolase [Lysinibacillus irui]